MIRQMFVPELYGMVSCPNCNGSGKLPKEPKGLEVCPKCGGLVFRKEVKY
jgi:DnaJ-class molecular chaperone